MRSRRLFRLDDNKSNANCHLSSQCKLSTGLMQVDCEIFYPQCSRSANIESSLIFADLRDVDEANGLDTNC